MYGDWFHKTDYVIFCHEVKVTERSPPANLTKKGIEQISRSVRTYVYLVLSSQVKAKSSIVGNSAPAVDALEVFKSTFKELIKEDHSIGINIERCQGVLEHALSKVEFSVDISK